MSDRPTFHSVTDVPCQCRYLERAAAEPSNPIYLDVETNEYHCIYGDSESSECGGAVFVIFHHCPHCGGAAPQSERDRLFTIISAEEEARVAELLAPIQSLDAARKAFGPPEFEERWTQRQPQANGNTRVTQYRELRFKNLSEVAIVGVYSFDDGPLSWRLLAKSKSEDGFG